jgi:hypothetical protein
MPNFLDRNGSWSYTICHTFADCKGQFVKQKLVLSSSFQCEQILIGFQSHFALQLKSDLDVEQTHSTNHKRILKNENN